jgi:hypothetical protein
MINLNTSFHSVLWIHISFNPDSNPAIHRNSDSDPELYEDKSMPIHADPEPGQTSQSQKVEFSHKKYMRSKAGNPNDLLILVTFQAPGSGSAFLKRIRIQDSQTNADPDPQHCHFYLLQC